MIKRFALAFAALWLVGVAHAETWTGCVGVVNTSGTDVTVTVASYPGYSWPVAAADKDIKYLEAGGQTVIMTAEHGTRPPIHVQPSNIGILWNFFIGEHDPRNSCTDAWRIVVAKSPCNVVVDNVCQ